MIYPKKTASRSNTYSTSSNTSKESKTLALVSKIAKALKIKHMNHFLSIGYDDKDLIIDINSHLTEDSLTKPTAEIFNQIEKVILSITKQKPCIKQFKNINCKGKKEVTAQANSIIPMSFSTLEDSKLSNNKAVPIELEYRKDRHELADQLKKKMELSNSQRTDHCATAPSQIKKELEEKKHKQQEEIAQFLQMQIHEKENKRQQLINEDKEYIANHLKQMQWNEKEALIEKKQRMQTEFKYSLDAVLKERKDYETSINNQRKQLESSILSANRLSLAMDKERQMEKAKIKRQLYQDQLNERNECSEIKKMKERAQLQMDKEYLLQNEEVMRKRERENEEVKAKMNHQHQSKNLLQHPLPISSLPLKCNDSFVKEREEMMRKADDKKQFEQKTKKEMVNKMKTGLEKMIKEKEAMKNMTKKLNNDYKDFLMNNHQLFLSQEELKKQNQRNQIRKYKEELDSQIKEKKKRELELFHY